ncbi:HPP family-domain-containing protein [Annulohypoxylon maeteangense]|uniref:HPP family-domain-containing protein n=1 Tax=Annulohypoxylon maeteangense TaxID=1927788 RepID=UPI0020078200|nr:HPP family-domain-containing protein [Annulohypoxylon maeteangense]KAI0881781.1 HPP family-domain-containing protein [Annulohypoxylon maeteangense]
MSAHRGRRALVARLPSSRDNLLNSQSRLRSRIPDDSTRIRKTQMPFCPSKWNFEIDDYLNPWLPAAPWKHIPYPIAHFLGYRPVPQRPLGNIAMTFWAFIGVFCSLTIIEFAGRAIPSFEMHGAPIIIGSFGAAAVLEFYVIESPLAQPRSAVLGQLFSSIIGVAISKLFALGSVSRDLTWLGGSLSCACSVAFMALTGTVHPPAGATALLAVVDEGVAHLGWFLLPVVLLGCVLMQCVALLLNNIQRRFPVYWWTPAELGHRKQQENSSYDYESENGAKLEIAKTHHLEGDFVEGAKVVIKRGRVLVPDSVYVSPEERIFLEELSNRL